MDFRFDVTAEGRHIKLLNSFDEHSHLCLAIRVGRRCKAMDVVAALAGLISLHPAPAIIRRHNGPEFIAHALWRRCEISVTPTAYSEPRAPWQNGIDESLNGRLREKFLNTELITTVAKA